MKTVSALMIFSMFAIAIIPNFGKQYMCDGKVYRFPALLAEIPSTCVQIIK